MDNLAISSKFRILESSVQGEINRQQGRILEYSNLVSEIEGIMELSLSPSTKLNSIRARLNNFQTI